MGILDRFRKNKLETSPALAVDDQVTTFIKNQLVDAIKSVSYPETKPTWTLHKSGRHDWKGDTAVQEGYQASAIVYACVEKRAKLMASVPWKAMRKQSDGTLEAVPDSPLQRLIDAPNPDTSTYEFIYYLSQSLDLQGNAYASKIKAGVDGFPVELWFLPVVDCPMKVKRGRQRLVDYYEYSKRQIEADDMIDLRMPNPKDLVFGMPVLMAAGKPADIDRESGIWQKVSLENRGAADINIKLPDDVTPEQAADVKKQYNKQQAGPKNARKALVSNADIQQLGQTAVELDFVASRRAVWTEICAAFGLSLANLGMTEDVNLANAQAMDSALWKNTIVPQLALLKRQLDRALAKDFGEEWELVPDLTNIEALQVNRNEKLDQATKLFAMGVPFETINNLLELRVDEFEGWEVSYLPSGLIPASLNLEDDDLPTGAEE